VWALGYTGQGVVVAGEDTGYEWDHPALKDSYRGNVGDTVDHAYNWHDAIHEINPGNGDSIISPMNNPCGLDSPVPCDDNGHGTHTMGIMTGEDGSNQIGVAPDAKWIACRNMERGWGSPATYLECMEFFLAPTDEEGQNPDPLKSPQVINNSWSCPESEGCNLSNFELMRQAVVNLRAAGIVMVVSAGNSGSSCGSVSAPLAIYEESFTVGSINFSDTIAGSSSRGPVVVDSSMRMKPNVCAPGVQVRSSWPDDSYRLLNGTSMAGPHVAGVVALMISANPQLAGQVEVIESIIETTARPKTTLQECGKVSGTEPVNNTFGHGIVDALAAVEAALMVSSLDEPEVFTHQTGPFTFFPNPVMSTLNIKGDDRVILSSLKVFASDGRLMYVAHDLKLPAQIDVRGLAQGLYFVQADNFIPARIQIVR
jgi:subtilisin family serine protease